jgi:hypothetical protein
MKVLLVAMVLAACGGPSQNQLAETPTAQTPRNPSLAPPASDDDKERYRLNEQFEDQRDAEQAHREAGSESKAPPPAPLPAESTGSGSAAPQKKK